MQSCWCAGTRDGTYAQLDARSYQIADALAKHRRSEAIVGIFKSGAALCVISTEYPDDRVDFMRKDSLWLTAP